MDIGFTHHGQLAFNRFGCGFEIDGVDGDMETVFAVRKSPIIQNLQQGIYLYIMFASSSNLLLL